MGLEIRRRLFVPRFSRFHWNVVAGATVECLVFVAAGGFSLWWWSPDSGRIDPSGFILIELSALALFALGAGFGLGAFLLSLQWVEVRWVGVGSHLVASSLAACGAILLGENELQASPASVGYWLPWMAFALAAALIAMGVAALVSLFVPVRHEIAR